MFGLGNPHPTLRLFATYETSDGLLFQSDYDQAPVCHAGELTLTAWETGCTAFFNFSQKGCSASLQSKRVSALRVAVDGQRPVENFNVVDPVVDELTELVGLAGMWSPAAHVDVQVHADDLVRRQEAVADALTQRVDGGRRPKVMDVGDVLRLLGRGGHPRVPGLPADGRSSARVDDDRLSGSTTATGTLGTDAVRLRRARSVVRFCK